MSVVVIEPDLSETEHHRVCRRIGDIFNEEQLTVKGVIEVLMSLIAHALKQTADPVENMKSVTDTIRLHLADVAGEERNPAS